MVYAQLGGEGGYVAFAAQTDRRIKAVVTVSAACMGALAREGICGTEHELTKADVQGNLRKLREHRNAEVNGKPAFTCLNACPGKPVLRSVDATVNYDSFVFVYSPPTLCVRVAD